MLYFFFPQSESTERTILYPAFALTKRGKYTFKVEYKETRSHLTDEIAGVMIPKGQLKVFL